MKEDADDLFGVRESGRSISAIIAASFVSDDGTLRLLGASTRVENYRKCMPRLHVSSDALRIRLGSVAEKIARDLRSSSPCMASLKTILVGRWSRKPGKNCR
jgi:hypothetical protein